MELGQTHVFMGLVTIVVAIAALFFIFYQLEQLADSCKVKVEPICSQLSGFTMSMLIVLLMVGGFVITITATVFILMSAD